MTTTEDLSTEDVEVIETVPAPTSFRHRLRRWSGGDLGGLAPYAISVVVAIIIVLLLGLLIWTTFQAGLPGAGSEFTWSNYQRVLENSQTFHAIMNSLIIGFGTLAVNLLIAVPAAYLVQRTDLPLKQTFTTLMLASVVIPSFLLSIGWILLLSPQIGLLNQALRHITGGTDGPLNVYNLAGIIFVQGLLLTPLMFFSIVGSVRAANPDLEEAAQMSGASRLVILLKITLPLLKPTIIAAAIYNFMTAIAIYDVQALLGSQGHVFTLSMLIYNNVNTTALFPKYGVAGVYGLVLMIPTLVALYFYQRTMRDSRKFMVITGKGFRSRLQTLGRWKPLAVALLWLYFVLSLVLPLLAVVWTSLVPVIRPPSAAAFKTITLGAYRDVMSTLNGGVLLNTAYLMLTVGVVVTLVSLCFSWSVVKSHFPGRRILDTVAMLPHAAPTIAFAFVLSFVSLAFLGFTPLYGSVTLIIVAHVIAFIGFGTRTLNSALGQVHTELEEAGRASGAGFFKVLRKITIPLVAPSILYTFIWVSLLSLREVTMSLLLQRADNTVIATQVWDYWVSARPSEAAALGTLLVIVATIVVGLVLKLARRYTDVGAS